MATNVPPVTFGPNGFVAPSDESILVGVIADIDAALGGGLNPGLTTPQGQLASSETAIISQAYQTFLYQSTQTDPAYATGRWQDAIARIYFLERNGALSTVLQLACVGLPGVNIPTGALTTDASGNVYQCTGGGTIPPTGTTTLPFANLATGPVAVPESVSIYQAIPGWDSVSVVSGVVGTNTETRSQFEARRAASVAGNSAGALPSVLGAVLSVPGVLDAFVTENNTNSPLTIGGVTLSPHSLYVAAVGGGSVAVATAVWTKKAPGCGTNGTTTETVFDTSPGYSPPFPSYQISYQIPFNLQILFGVVIKSGPSVPSNALQQVQGAILGAYAAGTAPKASIGSTIFALAYSTAIAGLGQWAQLVNIQIGSDSSPLAVFTGSISGATLTVTGFTSGAGQLAPGVTLSSGSGVSGSGAGSGSAIPQGTIITSQLSGTTGSTGTYAINNPQTVGSGLIRASTPGSTQVSVRIDQEPILSAPNIALTLL